MEIDEYLQSRRMYNMETIYEHTTQSSRIVAIKRQDGTTDIIEYRDFGTTQEDVMLHTLSINESDKFGAALCKDIIDNYTGHNSRLKDKIADLEDEARNVRYDNATLRDEKTRLKSIIFAMHAQVCERNATISDCVVEHNQHADQLCARIEYLEAINKGHDDCKEAFFKLLDKRSELEATNRGLEQDISNLRIANALYRKRWSEHETESASPESHGMKSTTYECIVKGFRGELSRHGKTIMITLPFEYESVARLVEKYIVGLED